MSPLRSGTNGPGSPERIEFSGAGLEPADSELEVVRPYRVVELLGEGGMGAVYMAEQTEPVRRQVALKIIKPGMDTKQVIARFEAERQALAVMDHPNIAKVFDGGATETGRPYFVMELVRGVPITEYCDMHKLSVRERLELFIPVCHAVQHAHQKGVIHRDMKPSNVLVAIQDGGKPVPKVIDFGIAKAIGQRLTDMTLHTQRGEAVGTPAYMSPEQAEMTGLDVDTRTDIYSLGVMLYELLAGDLPYDPKDLVGLAAIATLRETDPPTPSRRFKTLGDRQKVIAERRHTDPGSLCRALKGDLDWITMKAMEKDRTRRYETANGLAMDIQRLLHNRPVMARAPSTSYRIGKFVQRHKAGTSFAAVLLAVLVGFAVTLSIQAVRIAEERDRANREAATAHQVSDFLVRLFEVSDPSEALGNTITAREILDRGAERIETELGDQPLVRADLMNTMGVVYKSLGLYEAARPLLEESLAIREEALGPQNLGLAQSLEALGDLRWKSGKFDEARRLDQRALAIKIEALGPNHPDVASSLNNLGILLHETGDYAEAKSFYERALGVWERTLSPEHTQVAKVLSNLALALDKLGEHDESLPLLERALAIREATLPSDHPDIGITLHNLGMLYSNLGHWEEAQQLLERAVANGEKVFGAEHPQLAPVLNSLAILHAKTGEFAEARPLFERVLAIRETALAPEHPAVGSAVGNLGAINAEMGNFEVARGLFERGLEIKEHRLGPDHPDVANEVTNIASMLIDTGDPEAARPYMERALAIRETALGADHPEVAGTMGSLAELLLEIGDTAAARPLFEHAVAVMESAMGPQHADVATLLNGLARLQHTTGDYGQARTTYERARECLDRALRIREERLGEGHPYVADTLDEYAALLRMTGDVEKARLLESRAEAIRGTHKGPKS